MNIYDLIDAAAAIDGAEAAEHEVRTRLQNARDLEARLRAFAEKTEDGDA